MDWVLVGEARGELRRIERALRRIGRSRRVPRGIVLGGNFEVEAVETLPSVNLDAESSALPHGGLLWILFVSPLRQVRPAELSTKGASYLDRRCFPPAHFLDRLWRRVFLLAYGRWPTVEEAETLMPPLPVDAEAETGELRWIDMPQPWRRRTLGGVVGRVRWRGVPDDWLRVLVLGRHLQAGASTHFSFGRFVVEDTLGPLETPADNVSSIDPIDHCETRNLPEMSNVSRDERCPASEGDASDQ